MDRINLPAAASSKAIRLPIPPQLFSSGKDRRECTDHGTERWDQRLHASFPCSPSSSSPGYSFPLKTLPCAAGPKPEHPERLAPTPGAQPSLQPAVVQSSAGRALPRPPRTPARPRSRNSASASGLRIRGRPPPRWTSPTKGYWDCGGGVVFPNPSRARLAGAALNFGSQLGYRRRPRDHGAELVRRQLSPVEQVARRGPGPLGSRSSPPSQV